MSVAVVRRHARLVAVLALAVAVITGGWVFGRDVGLVRIERVEVTGATGPQASAVRGALTAATKEMTTLHVRHDDLREAVRAHPQVRDVVVRTDFPRAARLTVLERRPVAALAVGRRRVPLSADGTVLEGVPVDGRLPTVAAVAIPGRGHLSAGRSALALRFVASAPVAMRRHVERVAVGARGAEAQLRDGPRVLLGTGDRARAKWIAAGRVLSDPEAQGARYIDVRLPERPVAGGSTSG